MQRLSHQNIFALLCLSVITHALILWQTLPKNSISDALLKQNEKSIIKLRLSSDIIKQIVQSKDSKEQTKSEKAFLGKRNNSFLKQTVAKKTGTFQSAGKGHKQGVKKKQIAKLAKKKSFSLSKLGPGAYKPQSLEKKLVKRAPASVNKGIKDGLKEKSGLSQSNDFIQDIPLGDFTRLNTQEFEFYGFYHRIRQKLEQFWGKNIQEQADKLSKQGRSIASDTNHITALDIELNSKGEIVQVRLKGKSGFQELDETAIKTFNQAGPFPNPPKKMLKHGRALISWSFVVKS